MRCQRRTSWPARRTRPIRSWFGNRFGSRPTMGTGVGLHVLRRRLPSLTALRRFEMRSRHVERIIAPRISVSVTVVRGRSGIVEDHRGLPAAGLPAALGTALTGRNRTRRTGRSRAVGVHIQQPSTARLVASTRPPAAAAVPGNGLAGFGSRDPARVLVDVAPARAILPMQPPERGLSGVVPDTKDGSVNSIGRPAPSAFSGTPDIERLTDKVVAALDRRLWSQRERMGGR
jgi:hypothetical protein